LKVCGFVFGGVADRVWGAGALETDKLARSQSPVALSMMRAIKQALDPQNLMNPARVLARSEEFSIHSLFASSKPRTDARITIH
jgi:hypothetical protein